MDRRQFLKSAGAAVVAATVPSIPLASEFMPLRHDSTDMRIHIQPGPSGPHVMSDHTAYALRYLLAGLKRRIENGRLIETPVTFREFYR